MPEADALLLGVSLERCEEKRKLDAETAASKCDLRVDLCRNEAAANVEALRLRLVVVREAYTELRVAERAWWRSRTLLFCAGVVAGMALTFAAAEAVSRIAD